MNRRTQNALEKILMSEVNTKMRLIGIELVSVIAGIRELE